MFEEFHRGAGAAEADLDGAGLGLGLAIVRRMGGALGHAVSFSSVVGRGTVFHVEVPAVPGPHAEQAAQTELEQPRAYGLFGAKVLLIENDRAVVEGMTALLERWRCTVKTAATSAEAIDALGDTGWIPDIVIADQHLDDGDLGSVTIGAVRDYLGRNVPALIVTADPSETLAGIIRANGIEMMRKPVKPAQLRALMAHLLA